MDLKLSFVLPVYGVEKVLPKCMDSILSQITDACEVILVDDETPDRSGILCDEYAAKDPRVHVLHKKNGGPSTARNAGVRMAQGEYICFVDSDDYIREGTVEKLLAWIRDVHLDLCFLQSAKVYPDGTEEPVQENIQSRFIRGKSRDEILNYLASCPTFPGGPWGKIIRRQLLIDHNITFPEGQISEDLIYCLECYLYAQGIDCLDFPFYCYRQGRKESLTSTVTPSYFYDTVLFLELVEKRWGQNHRPENADGVLALSAAAFEYSVLTWQALELPQEKQDWGWDILKQYRWLLKWGRSPKTKMIRAAASVVGLKNAARLADFYQKHRG